jgi:hypothetical protein
MRQVIVCIVVRRLSGCTGLINYWQQGIGRVLWWVPMRRKSTTWWLKFLRSTAPREDPAVLAEALNLLASDRPEQLRSYMRRQLQQEGLPRFVLQVAAPLLQRVARARMMGEIKAYREGCLQELLMECLYVATSQLPGGETRPAGFAGEFSRRRPHAGIADDPRPC